MTSYTGQFSTQRIVYLDPVRELTEYQICFGEIDFSKIKFALFTGKLFHKADMVSMMASDAKQVVDDAMAQIRGK